MPQHQQVLQQQRQLQPPLLQLPRLRPPQLQLLLWLTRILELCLNVQWLALKV